MWGPRYRVDRLPPANSIEEKVALQWVACCQAVERAKALLESERWMEVDYDGFTRNPVAVLTDIGRFTRIPEIGALDCRHVQPANATQVPYRSVLGKDVGAHFERALLSE